MRTLPRTTALLIGIVAGFALLIGIGASLFGEDKSLLASASIFFATIVASLIPILSDEKKKSSCTAEKGSV